MQAACEITHYTRQLYCLLGDEMEIQKRDIRILRQIGEHDL